MLLVVNLSAGVVLFAVDLLALLSGEPSAIGGAVGGYLAVDVGLTLTVMRGLTSA